MDASRHEAVATAHAMLGGHKSEGATHTTTDLNTARAKQRELQATLEKEAGPLLAASRTVAAALDDHELGRDLTDSLRALHALAVDLHRIAEDTLANYLRNQRVESAFLDEDFVLAMELHVTVVSGAARQVSTLLRASTGARSVEMLHLAVHSFHEPYKLWYEKMGHAIASALRSFSDGVLRVLSKLFCDGKRASAPRTITTGVVIGVVVAGAVFLILDTISFHTILAGVALAATFVGATTGAVSAYRRCQRHRLLERVRNGTPSVSDLQAALRMQDHDVNEWCRRFNLVYGPMQLAVREQHDALTGAVVKEAQELSQATGTVLHARSLYMQLVTAYNDVRKPNDLGLVSCYMWLVAINIAKSPECEAHRLMHAAFKSTAAKTECVMSILHAHFTRGSQRARHKKVLQLMDAAEKEAVFQVDEVLRRWGGRAHHTAMTELDAHLMCEYRLEEEDLENIHGRLKTHVWPRMLALATADPFSMVAQFCRAKRQATKDIIEVVNQRRASGKHEAVSLLSGEANYLVFTAVWSRMFVGLRHVNGDTCSTGQHATAAAHGSVDGTGTGTGSASAAARMAQATAASECKLDADTQRLLSSSQDGPLFLACVAGYFAADAQTAREVNIIHCPAVAAGPTWSQLGDVSGDRWVETTMAMHDITVACAKNVLRKYVLRRSRSNALWAAPRGDLEAANYPLALAYCGLGAPGSGVDAAVSAGAAAGAARVVDGDDDLEERRSRAASSCAGRGRSGTAVTTDPHAVPVLAPVTVVVV